jgi:large subunit ribosomal protein L28
MLRPLQDGLDTRTAAAKQEYLRSRSILAAVSKVCHVCRKAPAFGNSRSHSMVATKRRFDPNLQRVRINDGGTPRRVYVCTRCLKAGKVVKAP